MTSLSYLQSILKEVDGTESRGRRRKQNIGAMLAAPNPVAPTVAPSAAAPHSMGDGHNHGSQGEVNELNAQFKSQLDQLIRDSGGKISVGSGYRSLAEQQVLYDRYKRGVKGQAPAAKPGSSNHNFGLAADLVYKKGGREFAHANAAKYGLVFPMSYEPWHIEPIGAKTKRKGTPK